MVQVNFVKIQCPNSCYIYIKTILIVCQKQVTIQYAINHIVFECFIFTIVYIDKKKIVVRMSL